MTCLESGLELIHSQSSGTLPASLRRRIEHLVNSTVLQPDDLMCGGFTLRDVETVPFNAVLIDELDIDARAVEVEHREAQEYIF